MICLCFGLTLRPYSCCPFASVLTLKGLGVLRTGWVTELVLFISVGTSPSLLTQRASRQAGREGKRSYLRTHILMPPPLLPTPPCPPPVSSVATRTRETQRAWVVSPESLSTLGIRPALPEREGETRGCHTCGQ